MHLITIDQILPLLLDYRYWILFPITIAEGPIITVAAGYLVSLDIFNFFSVYLLVVLGDLTGDILYYYAGKWGRLKFVERWGHHIGINPKKFIKVEQLFEYHGAKSLFWGKFTVGLGGMIIIAAGAAKVPFRKFMVYSTLGTIPKSFLLLIAGFYFGHAYKKIDTYFDYTATGMIILAILALIAYYAIQRSANRRINKQIQ